MESKGVCAEEEWGYPALINPESPTLTVSNTEVPEYINSSGWEATQGSSLL